MSGQRDGNPAAQPDQGHQLPAKRLGEILMRTAGLRPEQLSEGLVRQQALAAKHRHYPLGRILVGLGHLQMEHLADALAHQRPERCAIEEPDQEGLVARITSEAVRIQEEERRRISLELHDDVAQILGNLVLMMDACLAIAPPDAGQLRRYLGNARDTAKAGFRRVQRFALDLRPPMLDDLGLAPTVAWYAERFSVDTDIEVTVSIAEAVPHLNGEQETALFRIVQEALQNVRKHAHARHVAITLEPLAGKLRLSVADDGVGLDAVDVSRNQAEGTHLGLAGMRYRVALLGGSFAASSKPGRGTTISVEIPTDAV